MKSKTPSLTAVFNSLRFGEHCFSAGRRVKVDRIEWNASTQLFDVQADDLDGGTIEFSVEPKTRGQRSK